MLHVGLLVVPPVVLPALLPVGPVLDLVEGGEEQGGRQMCPPPWVGGPLAQVVLHVRALVVLPHAVPPESDVVLPHVVLPAELPVGPLPD